MQQFIILSVLAVVVLGDVSHLYRPSYGYAPPAPKPSYQQNQARPVRVFGATTQQRQQPAQPPVPIVRQSANNYEDGSYHWEYETANGIAAQEQGYERPIAPGQSVKSAQGSYQYTSPDGTPVAVSYLANENGYQPQGEHIPAAILRGLEYNAAHPPQRSPAARPYVKYG